MCVIVWLFVYVSAYLYELASHCQPPSKLANCKAWWAVRTDLKRSTTFCSKLRPLWPIMTLPSLQNYYQNHTQSPCHPVTIMSEHHSPTLASVGFYLKSFTASSKHRSKTSYRPFVPGEDMDPLVCLLPAHPGNPALIVRSSVVRCILLCFCQLVFTNASIHYYSHIHSTCTEELLYGFNITCNAVPDFIEKLHFCARCLGQMKISGY